MRGAALDQSNVLGWTPLLLASRHGHVSVVNLLLQNQADVNAETKLAGNALTLAARGGYLQVCKALIENGIDLSPSTRIGTATCEFTALMMAAHHGHDAVVRYLIDRGFPCLIADCYLSTLASNRIIMNVLSYRQRHDVMS